MNIWKRGAAQAEPSKPEKKSKPAAEKIPLTFEEYEKTLQPIPDDDPDLLRELEEMGFGPDDTAPKPKQRASPPASRQSTSTASAAPRAQSSSTHDPDLAALGIDLSGIGAGSDDEDEAGMEDDIDDPELLDQFCEIAGDSNEDAHSNSGSAEAPDDADTAVAQADESTSAAEDRADTKKQIESAKAERVPVVRAPSNPALLAAESNIAERRAAALALKKSGDLKGAMAALQEVRQLENALAVEHRLLAAKQIAAGPEVIMETSRPALPPRTGSGVSTAAGAGTPTAASAKGSSGAPPLPARKNSASSVTSVSSSSAVEQQQQQQQQRDQTIAALHAEEKSLLANATALVKEGKQAEAMVCAKRALALRDEAQQLQAGASSSGGSAAALNSSQHSSRGGESGDDADGQQQQQQQQHKRTASWRLRNSQQKPAVQKPVSVTDEFSGLEEALLTAMRAALEKAKELAKSVDTRSAAEAEKNRVLALRAELDRLKLVRALPGAHPPSWGWQLTQRNKLRVLDEVPADQLMLHIDSLHGLNELVSGKVDAFVQYELNCGPNNDKSPVETGRSTWFKIDSESSEPVTVDFTCTAPVKRGRNLQHRKAVFEIIRKKGLFRGQESMGKVVVPLAGLLTSCSIEDSAMLLGPSKREIPGCIMDLTLKVRKPLLHDEVIVVQEKELVVGKWPAIVQQSGSGGGSVVMPDSPPPGATLHSAASPQVGSVASVFSSGGGQQQFNSNGSSSASATKKQRGRGGGAGAVAAAAAAVAGAASAVATAKGGSQGGAPLPAGVDTSILTEFEMSDPLAPEHIDSNNVLEAELAAYGPQMPADAVSAARKGGLELKLRCLEGAVSGGELSLADYCDILDTRLQRDKVLAAYLKSQGRIKEAVRVLSRVKIMGAEVAEARENL